MKKLKDKLDEQKANLQEQVSSGLKNCLQATEKAEHKEIFTNISECHETVNKIQSDSLCIICNSRPREVAFLDCFHVIACENCSFKLEQCPIDKGPIKLKKKILFS